jgi:hypothetical protein
MNDYATMFCLKFQFESLLHISWFNFLSIELGTPLSGYKEKYTKVDNEKRLKEAEVIEGGYLELGFTLFRV